MSAEIGCVPSLRSGDPISTVMCVVQLQVEVDICDAGMGPSIVGPKRNSAGDPSRLVHIDYLAGGLCWTLVGACVTSISELVALLG